MCILAPFPSPNSLSYSSSSSYSLKPRLSCVFARSPIPTVPRVRKNPQHRRNNLSARVSKSLSLKCRKWFRSGAISTKPLTPLGRNFILWRARLKSWECSARPLMITFTRWKVRMDTGSISKSSRTKRLGCWGNSSSKEKNKNNWKPSLPKPLTNGSTSSPALDKDWE